MRDEDLSPAELREALRAARARVAELEAVQAAAQTSDSGAAEVARWATRSRLQRAQHLARLGFWEWSLATNLVQWSTEFFEIYGLDPDSDPTIERVRELIHPDDVEIMDSAMAAVSSMEGAIAPSIEYRILRPDGEERTVQAWAQLDRDETGAPVRMFGAVQDITESKISQQVLRESDERLRVAFDATADSLILLDREHRIQMGNAQEGDLTHEDVIGRPIYELLSPPDQERVRALLDRAIQEVERQTYEVTYTAPDGREVHYSSIAAPIIVAGQVTGTIVSSRDVTEARRLEADRQRLEEEQRQSQKMEAVGRLAGGVAHDFNNILCAISGNAELALADLPDSARAEESLAEIARAAERAAGLTHQLLAFSRKQVIEPKVLDLDGLIEGLHPMLVRVIGEDVALTTRPGGPTGRVRADPGQIEQIVVNLAVNARDAMPQGGELCIETADSTIGPEQLGLHPGVEPGAYVTMTVTDSGFGMTPDVQERIFEPFFTTKERGQGTGLGLSTVFGIVEQSEGHIEVRSEPGAGSSFRIFFPRIDAATDDLSASTLSATAGGGETILLVEDEEMVRRLAEKVLVRVGYRVLVASSGREAIELVAGHRGPIDLLLTDVVMPLMNGSELARRLLASHADLEVLFTSGYTDDVIARHGVLDEGIQFLPKPYSLTTLTARVRELLDARGSSGQAP